MIRTWAAALAIALAFTSASHLVCEWACAADSPTPAPATCAHERSSGQDVSLTAVHICTHDADVTLGAPTKIGHLERLAPYWSPAPDLANELLLRASSTVHLLAPPGSPSTPRPLSTLRI